MADAISPKDALRRKLARRLRLWRERDAKLSQEAVARALGMSLRNVRRLEAGQASLRADAVHLLEELHPGLVERLFPQRG